MCRLWPSQTVDIELEMGGDRPARLCEFGTPITVDQGDAMIFGYVLLNELVAREFGLGISAAARSGQAFRRRSLRGYVHCGRHLIPSARRPPAREKELLPYLDSNPSTLVRHRARGFVRPKVRHGHVFCRKPL